MTLPPTVDRLAQAICSMSVPAAAASIAVIGVIYMLPALVAVVRGHSRKRALTVANLVSGWSLIVWAGLLTWAIFDRKAPPSVRHPDADGTAR